MRSCLDCGKSIEDRHRNAKRCEGCAHKRREKPIPTLTKYQKIAIRKLAGTMFVKDLADAIGTSKASLTRYARAEGISLNALQYKDEVIEKVCKYYEAHGKAGTQKKFKGVKVRSIIERYYKKNAYAPRQTQWSHSEIIFLLQRTGLWSDKKIAETLNRPNAFTGSIKSFRQKRLPKNSQYLNGLPFWIAKTIVVKECTAYATGEHSGRWLITWVDLSRSIGGEDDVITKCINILALFQLWLHGGEKQMREVLNGIFS